MTAERGEDPRFAVREERPDDREAVSAVQAAAFGRDGEATLVDALRASVSPRVSLVATPARRPDTIVGHVFVSPVTLDTEPGAADLCALAPIGVAPGQQGRGAGGALVRAALAASRAAGFRAVFLLGDPAYYARFGFALAAPRGLHYASHDFDAAFQQIELVPGALARRRGFVLYPAAFDALG
ncbi:MAG TPA: N-acetyltransferase [Myxococcota bacterium]|nr:N-acetyltransferase [Myxococcota bacterium]